MKKILTVSLFAMMAVSAANADIASTEYVTDRTGTTASLETEAKELTGAVNELKAKLDTVAGSGEGSVSDQIDSALEDYTDTAGMNSAIATAKGELTTEIGKVDDKADANAAAIAGLDDTYATDTALSDGLALKQDKSAMVGDTNFNGNKTTVYPTLDLTETLISEANNDMAGEVQQVASDLNAYKTSNNAEVAKKANSADVYTKTAADAEFMNSAEVEAAIAGAVTGTDGALKDYVTTTVFNQSQTTQTNELQEYADSVAATAKSGAESTAAAALNAYKTSNDAAVATKANSADVYTKTAADAEFMNSAEVDAAIAGAVTGTDGVLKNYSTTEQMNTAITNANTTITNAYKAADAETLEAAKADATSKANTAKSEAIAAAKSAGDAAYAAKSYETIVDANEAFREAIASGTTGSDGTYALTATVSNNTVSGYKWELIGR